MIKKAVRLTESDLNRLVNKVIKEQAKFEFDPKDLEMPDVDKLRDMFLSNDASPEVEKMGGDFKKAMNSCVSERNLYKVGGLLKNIETKKSNILNTIVAMLFDSKMGGKSIGQEFNEFSDCINKKIGGKMDGIFEQSKISSSSSKEYNMIDTCASMGVKTPGYCDTKGKKPVKSCASLGVKTPGFCYVDSKKPIPNQAPKGKDSIKEQMAAATGQSVPQNTTGNDRISNLANMMRNLQTKQVPQKVIVAPGSQLNGMLWTDYLKQFKITKQELAQANALMSKLGVNPQSQKPGPGAVKSTPTTKGTTPQKPTDAATAKRQQIDARRNTRQQQTAGGVKPTNPTSRMPVR
jgi:hypothetical protein